MEVAIILIAVVIIGYVIYQSLPKQKFQKAGAFLDAGNFVDATKILNLIFEKHPDAPAKLAECKLKEGQSIISINENQARNCFNEVLQIKKQFPANASKENFELIEAQAYLEIGQLNFNSALSESNIQTKVEELKENLSFVDAAIKIGIEAEFSKLKIKHVSELAEIHFQFGIQKEKIKKLPEASQNYVMAKDYSMQSSNFKILHSAITRIGICQLKNQEHLETSILDDVTKTSLEYKKDFFFRYAKRLLQDKQYYEAERIITTYLNFSSPETDKIKEVLKNQKIKSAIKKVNEINYKVERLYENALSVEDIEIFYETVDKQIEDIKAVIPNLAEKLHGLKPSLFNRLLGHYMSEKQYVDAINLIQKFPLFWESPELLKNLGICCFGFTSQGNLSEKNYRVVLSNWLTSVFSDKVILKSLEATTWDDSYTFTLTDSIGSNYTHHSELPSNANYDEETDTNISIGETQRELLQQFESLLHKTISDQSLAKIVNDFYIAEKEAIQNIVSIINKDILFAAPHFAKTYSINVEIVKELDDDFVEYSNEQSLEFGIPYLKNNADTYVREYSTAKELVSKMVSAIKDENQNELKAILTDRKVSLIEKYETINESAEDLVFAAFSFKIEENEGNENLIPLMEECIRYLKQNQKIKTQFSSFVHDFCDSKWKSKSPIKLLELMIKSITHNPNNYRAAKSITLLINNNLMDIANDNTTSSSQIYSLIEDVKKIKSDILKDALKELLVLRKKVLTSMGAEASKTILLGYNLNANGLKIKKVLDTMQAVGGG